MRIHTLFLCFFSALVAIGCSDHRHSDSPRAVESDASITSMEERRIVSANATLTELLCEFGLATSIVATDATSMYPQAIASAPKLGYRHAITAEAILGMSPTDVVLTSGDLREDVLQSLQAAGVRVHVFSAPQSVSEVAPLANDLAKSLGTDVQASTNNSIAQLSSSLDSCHQLLVANTEQRVAKPTAVFVYSLGNGTAMCAGSGTAMHSVMESVGLTNVFADIQGYKPVNIESLISKSPLNVIVFNTLIREQGSKEVVASALRTDKWKVQPKLIHHDASYLATYGPRIGEALLWLQVETTVQ